MFTLTVKNFGVLKDINIELNKTNLFIGENGSGKSVLAKLITIVTSFIKYTDEFFDEFIKLDINFIDDDTVIKFSENTFVIFTIENKRITFSDEVLVLSSPIDKKRDTLNTLDNINRLISQYIPAERNLISLLNKSIYSLITSDIPLPKHLLNFASQYEKARNEIKELELLGMKYKSKSGQDRIYYNKNDFLPLENSSSGIQSSLPLYLTLKYFASKHRNIIIEEPELNLYPKAQVDTTKYIIENSSENLYIMTHSPYILSTLNILLFAYKASNTNEKLKEKISKIIPEEEQINPDEFSAYLIENGKSINIKSKRGLISENSIDKISDTIDDEFSDLMDVYREHKDD